MCPQLFTDENDTVDSDDDDINTSVETVRVTNLSNESETDSSDDDISDNDSSDSTSSGPSEPVIPALWRAVTSPDTLASSVDVVIDGDEVSTPFTFHNTDSIPDTF